MVQVANLEALKTAQDGDYINQNYKGEAIRLYRRGIDQKGNLITESKVISSSLVVVDDSINIPSASQNPVQSQAIARRFQEVKNDISQWRSGGTVLNSTFPLSPRPFVLNLPNSGNYYQLPLAPSFLSETDNGQFVWLQNRSASTSFEIRVQDGSTNVINFGPTPQSTSTSVTVPPNSDARFYQVSGGYQAHIVSGHQASDKGNTDRLLDSGTISIAPKLTDDDGDLNGFPFYEFNEDLSDGDICFYEYHYQGVNDDGTGVAVLRDQIQQRHIPWDNLHRIKFIWLASTPKRVYFAAGTANNQLRITRVQILKKTQLVQNQFIALTQAAYDALSKAEKDDASKLYLIDG